MADSIKAIAVTVGGFGVGGLMVTSEQLGWNWPDFATYLVAFVSVLLLAWSAYLWTKYFLMKLESNQKYQKRICIIVTTAITIILLCSLYYLDINKTLQDLPKLTITTKTKQFVNGAIDLLEPKVILAITNNATTTVDNVEVYIKDISIPDENRASGYDANQKLLQLNETDINKQISINPGDSKYFIFGQFIQSDGQPLHIKIGNHFINKNRRFNFLVTYSGSNSPVQSAKLYLEYSDQLYKFGIVGEEDYVEREIPFFGRSPQER